MLDFKIVCVLYFHGHCFVKCHVQWNCLKSSDKNVVFRLSGTRLACVLSQMYVAVCEIVLCFVKKWWCFDFQESVSETPRGRITLILKYFAGLTLKCGIFSLKVKVTIWCVFGSHLIYWRVFDKRGVNSVKWRKWSHLRCWWKPLIRPGHGRCPHATVCCRLNAGGPLLCYSLCLPLRFYALHFCAATCHWALTSNQTMAELRNLLLYLHQKEI